MDLVGTLCGTLHQQPRYQTNNVDLHTTSGQRAKLVTLLNQHRVKHIMFRESVKHIMFRESPLILLVVSHHCVWKGSEHAIVAVKKNGQRRDRIIRGLVCPLIGSSLIFSPYAGCPLAMISSLGTFVVIQRNKTRRERQGSDQKSSAAPERERGQARQSGRSM